MKTEVAGSRMMPSKAAQNGNEVETETETKRKRGRGVYRKHAPNRPKSFLVGWSDGGPIRWQSFATEQEREDAAERLTEAKADHGNEILAFDPREWRRWQEFKEKAGDVDPFDILREWQAMRGETAAGAALTVADTVKRYLEFREGGDISADTRRHFEKHLRDRFAADYGSVKLRDVGAELIGGWLKRLKHPKTGRPMEPVTVRHHRKDLNTFLAYCVRAGWLTRNPCEVVAVPAVPEDDVQLLTVKEGHALFEKNAGQRVLGRLALEAFGFLRASSAGRIQADDINRAEKGIRMPGAKHKSRKTKFRQGHPDNLWKWIEAAPAECWKMTPIQYRNEKHDAFVRAGIKGGSENRLRKTCLSAHLAWLKNQPLTSYLAQHRHSTTTEIYLGVMLETDGKAWFEIAP